MQSTGLLVTAWPIVLGCDASGIVVKVGDAASSVFQVGDRVCGCRYSPVFGSHFTALFNLRDMP